MKTITILNSLVALALSSAVTVAGPMGTAFTYQGRLTDSGNAYSGSAEFQPTLWDGASGGSQVAANSPVSVMVGVTNGLFVLPLDFGASFPGADRWLQLEVRTAIGPFTMLTPRQQLTPTPYAITASNLTGTLSASQLSGTLPSGQLSGTYSGAVTFNSAANVFNGSFAGSGASLSNVNATMLEGFSASNFWRLGGNNITSNDFIGTYGWGTPLNFRIGGQRVLRLEYPDAGSVNNVSPTVIGGNEANHVVSAGGYVRGGVIAGGGSLLYPNVISNATSFDTISGGLGNVVSNFVDFATIGGGQFNRASADEATVSGGGYNKAAGFSSAIGGGGANTAAGSWSTVPGGRNNAATGDYTFAAGRRAKADGTGSFVWADSNDFDLHAWGENEFVVRATGGYWLFSGVDGAGSPTNGVVLAAGSGTWGSWSDRNAKTNCASVNARAVLDKVTALSIATWNYKTQDPSIRHIGPMAQDFYAAFGVGDSDKTITTVDADGVALAAIQGLNQKLTDELQRRDVENAKLKERLKKLEHLMNQPNGGAR